MPLHANIILHKKLADYEVEGDYIHGMNQIYHRLNAKGDGFYDPLTADASIGEETNLRHYTIKWEGKTKTCSVFFRAVFAAGVWLMDVYAYGKHKGDNNKRYELYTYLNGKKARQYTF
ncbi:MAG: hypothetical protein AAF242_00495 [Bacteroidota bacterium]